MKSNQQKMFVRFAVPAACAVALLAAPATAQISVVVAKSSTQSVDKDAVKDVFAGAKVVWSDGKKIQVVDQAETETGQTFYETVVGKALGQVRLQWTKLVLSGQAVGPKKLSDDASVKAAVAADPNAIGYIKSSSVDGSVKEIARF